MSSKLKNKTLHRESKYKRYRRRISWMHLMNPSLSIPVVSKEVIIKVCYLDESLKQNISIHYKAG